MGRRYLPMVGGFPYHVFARANNQDWFYLPQAQVWEICLYFLTKIWRECEVNVISFVLMSNHFHLLLTTPKANLGAAMNYFMREVSKEINRRAGRINHVFGGPYKGCLIEETAYLYHVYRYVYQNPVAANICTNVEDYRFSTIKYLTGEDELPFRLKDEQALKWAPIPQPIDSRLQWMNEYVSPKERELIRRGLSTGIFKVPKTNDFRHERQSLNSVLSVRPTVRTELSVR